MKERKFKYKFKCKACQRQFFKNIGKDVDQEIKCPSCESTDVVMLSLVG